MYKIDFDPNTCVWQIQLSRFYGLYWATLKDKAFANIGDAENYVKGVGLDKVYKDYRDSYADVVMRGAR